MEALQWITGFFLAFCRSVTLVAVSSSSPGSAVRAPRSRPDGRRRPEVASSRRTLPIPGAARTDVRRRKVQCDDQLPRRGHHTERGEEDRRPGSPTRRFGAGKAVGTETGFFWFLEAVTVLAASYALAMPFFRRSRAALLGRRASSRAVSVGLFAAFRRKRGLGTSAAAFAFRSWPSRDGRD